MDESKPKESKIVRLVSKNVNAICTLSYLGGVVWFLALSLRDVGSVNYQSENALLPGLQQPHFTWSEGRQANAYNDEFSRYTDPSDIRDRLERIMQESSILTETQTFSSTSPLPERINGTITYKVENGTNLYGIVRAGRASSTESIVLNVPLTKDNYNYAVGIALTFGKQIREQQYWAKDIILLFSENGYIGVQAWLQSYFNIRNSEFIQSSPLEERAGNIMGSLVLDMPEKVSYLNVDVVGNNGQLPNLDLFNVLIRLCRIDGILVSIHGELKTNRFDPMSMKGYLESLRTTLKMMSLQARGFSYGNHAMFLQHNIQSLSIKGVTSGNTRKMDIMKIGRVAEGLVRSMNNLLEKFHQSFFFYLLSATDRFISIGQYMPPMGLIILGPALKKSNKGKGEDKSEEEKEQEQDSETETLKEMLREMDSPLIQEEEEASSPTPWIELSYVISISYLFGVGLYFSPKFAVTWSAMFDLSSRNSILLIFSSMYLAGFSIPFTSLVSFTEADKVIPLLRTIALVTYAGTLGCVSVINFSLGMFLALFTVPFITHIDAKPGKLQVFRILSAFLATPAFIFLGMTIADRWFCGEQLELIHSTESSLRHLYTQSILGNNWIFPFICLLVYPNWLVFWVLSLTNVSIVKP